MHIEGCWALHKWHKHKAISFYANKQHKRELALLLRVHTLMRDRPVLDVVKVILSFLRYAWMAPPFSRKRSWGAGRLKKKLSLLAVLQVECSEMRRKNNVNWLWADFTAACNALNLKVGNIFLINNGKETRRGSTFARSEERLERKKRCKCKAEILRETPQSMFCNVSQWQQGRVCLNILNLGKKTKTGYLRNLMNTQICSVPTN